MTRTLWMPACLLGLFLANSLGQAQTGSCDPGRAATPATGLVPYYHQLPQVIFYGPNTQCAAPSNPDKPTDCGAMTAVDCLRLWQILWSLGKYEEAQALAERACQVCPGNVDAEHARALAQIMLQHAAQHTSCCPTTGCGKTASPSCPTACGMSCVPAGCGSSCGPCSEACDPCGAETACTATGCCKKKGACGDKCASGKDCCCSKKACACGPNCKCCEKGACAKTCACGPNCACCKKTCACGPDCACCKKTCACGPNCACKEKSQQDRLVRQLKALQKLIAERCPPCIGFPGMPGMPGFPAFTAPLPAPMMICPDHTVMEMPCPPPCPGMGMPCHGMPCPPMMGLPGMPPCAPGACAQPMQAPVPATPVSRPVENMTPSSPSAYVLPCPPCCPAPAASSAASAHREPIAISAKGGRVHIKAPSFQGTCDNLTYEESSDQVILTGAVRLNIKNFVSGKDTIRAERVEVGVHNALYRVMPIPIPGSEACQAPCQVRKPSASPCSNVKPSFQPKACWPTCPCE